MEGERDEKNKVSGEEDSRKLSRRLSSRTIMAS